MLFKRFKRSFGDAFRGLSYTFRHEISFRIQIAAAIVVLAAVFYLPLKKSEQVVIIMMVTLVLVLELANSVLERLIDLFQPKIDYIARVVKDILAAAVLLAAVASAAIGLIIFLPYIRALF